MIDYVLNVQPEILSYILKIESGSQDALSIQQSSEQGQSG